MFDLEAIRSLIRAIDPSTKDGRSALVSLRSMINGMLGKRSITPEQQAKMQAARKKGK